jgi:hypothetical protein
MQSSIEKLVTTLLEGTKNGTIQWEQTARKTEFRTSISAGSITVDKWDWTHEESDETGTTADIAVFNKAGEKIDTCVAYGGADFAKLAQLHEAVRRKVLKVDETIESIFKELQVKVTGTHKSQ